MKTTVPATLITLLSVCSFLLNFANRLEQFCSAQWKKISFSFFVSVVVVLTAGAQNLVINELYVQPSNGKQEFFELYNTSISAVAENTDCYTLVTYFVNRKANEKGFYVLDLPNKIVPSQTFFIASSSSPFSYQPGTMSPDYNWNAPTASSSTKKYVLSGSTYTQSTGSFPNIFVKSGANKENGNGDVFAAFLFYNGQAVDVFFGAQNTNVIPDFIANLPDLFVDMKGACSDFTVDFSELDNDPSLVTNVEATVGTNNGYRTNVDGSSCSGWQKSSSPHEHTPGKSNGKLNVQGVNFKANYDCINGGNLSVEIISGDPVNITAYHDMAPVNVFGPNDVVIGSQAGVAVGSTFTLNGSITQSVPLIVVLDASSVCYNRIVYLQCPIPPVAQDITTSMIINPPGTPAQKVGKDFPMAGTDEDGYVVNYIIKSLPSSGVLYWDNDNNSSTPDVAINSAGNGMELTKQQIKTVTYDPADGFSGNAIFTYTVKDNDGLKDATPATYTIPVNPPPVTNTFICVPSASNTNKFNVCPMVATDEGTVVSYTVVTLPQVSQGKVYLYGTEVSAGQELTPAQASQLTFKPGGSFVGYAEITYTATDEKDASDPTPATLTLQLVNQPPVAKDISAPTIVDPLGLPTLQYPLGLIQVPLPALTASDIDGTVSSYMITNVAPANQGVLYLNNVPVTDNQVLTLSEAAALKFDANDNFSGIAKFYFTATDNDGLTDNTPATYSIPVKEVLPIANDITNNSIYTGANQTLIKPLTGSDPDLTNIISAFIVTELPEVNKGVLYSNSASGYVPVAQGLQLTTTQATTLKFKPAAPFTGNAIFRYTVKDDEGYTDPTAAIFTIPVTNKMPVAYNKETAAIRDTAGVTRLIPALSATDEDGSIASFIIHSLPKSSTGRLTLNGSPVTEGMVVTVANAGALYFDPTLYNNKDGKFKYTAVDNMGAIADKYAEYTIKIEGVPHKKKPKAIPVTNPAIPMNAAAFIILPMVGSDTDGVVKSYRFRKLPNKNQEGQLFVQGIPISNDQIIPAAKADKLTFVPTGEFIGTTSFNYIAIDNDEDSSDVEAQFLIPVENTKPEALDGSIQEMRKGTTMKLPSLSATDVDGIIVSYQILSVPTMGTLQYDKSGNGSWENISANKTLNVAEASRLRFIAGNYIGTTTFTFTAKDSYNGVSNVATFTIPVGTTGVNQKPIANNVTSTSLSLSPVLSSVSALSGTDLDGTIAKYRLETVPPDYFGTLYYNSASVYVAVTTAGIELTLAQATTLKYKPSGSYAGDVIVWYRAIDNSDEMSEYASFTIPVINAAPVTTSITNPSMVSSNGPTVLSTLAGTDDGTISHFIIAELPSASEGLLIMDGIAVETQQVIPMMYANRLEFDPRPSFKGTATFKFSALDSMGAVDQTPATFSIAVVNDKPRAHKKVSQVITNQIGTGAQILPAMTAEDNDGTISSFVIKSLPLGGKLYKNGSLISSISGSGYSVSTWDASTISFDPNDSFSGTASFTYSAKDNDINESDNVAVYEIFVNRPPVTANVSSNAMAAGAQKAQINPLVGSDDVNVSFYSITILPDANDGTLYVSNTLVTSLAQVDSLSATQISELSFEPTASFDGAIFTYTATDNIGVIDVTPAVYQIPVFYTGSVLPVELVTFRANRSTDTDDLLKWSTSREINSDYFVIEYSPDGSHFDIIGTVNAKGTPNVSSDYTFEHKNVAGTVSYYRLKIVDKNSSYRLSKVVLVRRLEGLDLVVKNLYPNPITDRVNISFVSVLETDARFSLLDLNGRVIKTILVKLVKGNNSLTIDNLGGLVKGNYLLSIKNQDMNIIQKLIKQ